MAKTEETKLKNKEVQTSDIERTSSRQTFVPHTDIIENETGLVVIMDIPGAVEKDVDINLDDNILTILAKVEEETFDGYRPLYSEYGIGDFQRSFRLNEAFDADKIVAKLENGVLTLNLPKAEKKKPKKIKIKS